MKLRKAALQIENKSLKIKGGDKANTKTNQFLALQIAKLIRDPLKAKKKITKRGFNCTPITE